MTDPAILAARRETAKCEATVAELERVIAQLKHRDLATGTRNTKGD
jgi:hypothetical protein